VVKDRNKITVILDAEEFDRFESFCKQRGFKKSTLIARLIREHLDKEGFQAQRQLPLGSSRGR